MKNNNFSNSVIKNIYDNYPKLNNQEINFVGWVKNIRVSKNIIFLNIADGSTINSIQVICKNTLSNFNEIAKLTIATAIKIVGKLVITTQNKQPFEIIANNIDILTIANNDYPLQKKEHSLEFLREIAHLRGRTNLFLAVFRIRSMLSFAIHQFFQENDFVYVNSPIITTGDCEGAGECFVVKTQDNSEMFTSKSYLSVSGQLNAEAMALAFKKVYTFAPTFRAEKSNTIRHLAEFWMIEPEVSFCDLNHIIDISHKMIQSVFNYILIHAKSELKMLSEINNVDLISRLETIANNNYKVITYAEAVDILQDAIQNKNIKFENNQIEFGIDFNIEHEKYICDKVFKKPVYIINYPKSFKAFYMKVNADEKTVASFDMLVPEIGELIGGSERETDINIISARAKDFNISLKSIQWYLDLRKYGYYKSSGFGLGFERLIMYVTGISNIRDSILFPRSYGKINF